MAVRRVEGGYNKGDREGRSWVEVCVGCGGLVCVRLAGNRSREVEEGRGVEAW